MKSSLAVFTLARSRFSMPTLTEGKSLVFGQVRFDLVDLDGAVALIAGRTSPGAFAAVVTVNSDHFVRLSRSKELRAVYDRAWLSVCDSRILRLLARLRGVTLTLVTGSDLCAALFGRVIGNNTPITVIGGSVEMAARLRARFS